MKGKTDDKIDMFEGFPILGSNLSPDSHEDMTAKTTAEPPWKPLK